MRSLKLKHIFQLILFLGSFLFVGKVLASESDSDIEARITEYCESYNINRKDYSYSGVEFALAQDTFDTIKTEYHNDINKLFTDSIQKMRQTIEDNPSLTQKCTSKNVTKKIKDAFSTYEISQKGICRFAFYTLSIKQKDKEISNNLNGSEFKQILQDYTGKVESSLISDVYQALALYQEDLEKEQHLARIAFERSLKAYDEMIVMYPLHIRLRCIISDLIIYREKLGKLVNVFFCMERYIGAASDKVD